METDFNLLIQAVVNKSITELEAERLLNAIARATAGVPTGTNKPTEPHTRNLS